MTLATPSPASPALPPGGLFFDPTVAHNLVGQALPNGWVVTRKLRTGPGAADETGGHFSVGYVAERDKREAFVKVFDLATALAVDMSNIMAAMAKIAQDHQYESNLLDLCNSAGLDRIVTVLDRGQAMIAAPGGFPTPLPYIVFELANGDIRKTLAKSTAIEEAWLFRMLHQVAVGLQQLHGQAIAHQDLKPSNILTFDEAGAKIADLGRASRNDGRGGMPHDGLTIAGALAYAPPEQAYGVQATEWRDRREGCDLYHLGCLIAFVFTGTTPNEAYLGLPEAIRPPTWGGKWNDSYEAVYPQISATFAAYLAEMKADLPGWAADRIISLVADLCNPDYLRRGDPTARGQADAPLGIDRFISRLDRLAHDAKVQAKKA